MIYRLALLLCVFSLAACTERQTPAQKEDRKTLRREIEKPLNRAHEAEATAKAQAEENEKALKEAAGE